MALGDGRQRVQGGVVVAAAGMQLEVVSRDLPAGAEALGHRFRVEAVRGDPAEDVGDVVQRAAETGLQHVVDHEAHLAGDAGENVADRAPLEHRAPAGAEAQVGGEVHGLAHAGSIGAG